MNALDKIEGKILDLWNQRSTIKGEAEGDRERLRAAEAAKAKAQEALPGLRKRETAALKKYEKAIDALQSAMQEIDAINAAVGGAFGRPRFRVHKGFRRAVKGEQDRREMRARAAAGDRESADRERRKAEAAYRKEQLKEQKRAARRVSGDLGQADRHIDAAEAKIRRLEGKQAPAPTLSEADQLAMDAYNMAQAHLGKAA